MACPCREVRNGYAARTAYAKRMRPFGRAKAAVTQMGGGCFVFCGFPGSEEERNRLRDGIMACGRKKINCPKWQKLSIHERYHCV